MVIKGQTLIEIVAEFTYVDTTELARTANNVEAVKGIEMGNGETFVIR